MPSERILVVDDEQSMRDFLSIFLRKQGFDVACEPDGEHALARLRRESFDLVITDMRMGQMNGMELLNHARQLDNSPEFIVMTAFSSNADAIMAMKDGAYDYITKPFNLDEIRLTIRKALERRASSRQQSSREDDSPPPGRMHNIIAVSDKMVSIFERIQKVAATRATVLISGESGTGKELVARAIHAHSPRAERPFVTINCGAIPGELMESELFGHMRGSFTGAVRDKEGLFTIAAEGTLFLDEVSELPLPLQVKLLRVLQEKRVVPVGGTREIEIDTRVIAATNRDLLDEVRRGNFREDLYYRLNVIEIQLPPLRERREDIPLLIHHFINRAASEMGREPLPLSKAAMMILNSHDYPGNVRELGNIIERAVALETSDQIRPESLPGDLLERQISRERRPVADVPDPALPESAAAEGPRWPVDLDGILEGIERRYIEQALAHTGGNKTDAARLLGMTFRSLRYRLQKLGIDKDAT